MPSHRLLLELGRGGMGTVFLAVSEGPGGFTKLKVVKQLRDDLAENAPLLQMFLEEARLAARLNHPNIVQTNEVGSDGRHHFIEMEYLEGQSLDALTRRTAKTGRGLPIVDAVWVITQILAALDYAHTLMDVTGRRLQIVHRDVSPHNVFVTFEGAVKLLDFGIAKAVDSAHDTATGIVKGKVTYMSPEQALRRPLDGRSDVFSVGVMLWQLVTGERLWNDLSDFEVYMRLESGDIPSAQSVRKDVDPVLNEICGRALAKDPTDRYATAADMQAALDVWLEGAKERAGSKRLAKILSEVFADRREAIRKEIEAQLQHVADAPRPSAQQVPLLTETQAYQGTITNSAVEGKPTQHPTRPEGTPSAARRTLGDAVDAAEATRTTPGIISDPAPRPRREAGRRTFRTAAWLAAFATVALILATEGSRFRSALRSYTALPSSMSAAVASSEGGVEPCRTSSECVDRNGGTPYLCSRRDHVCVAAASEDCEVHASSPSDPRNDDTLWIGAVFGYRRGTPDMRWETRAVELAQSDFAKMTGGIPRPGNAKGPRPIAVLLCDDTDNPARVADHLVALGVPAVIGFGRRGLDMISSKYLPNGVFAIDSRSTSRLLSSLPMPPDSPRFVWRLNASSDRFLDLTSALVTEVVEPRVLADRSFHATKGAVRLAVLQEDTIGGVAESDYLMSRLKLNGRSSADQEQNIRTFALPVSRPGLADPAYVSATLPKQLLEFKPNIVIIDAGGIYDALRSIEQGGVHPFYLTLLSLDEPDARSFVGKNSDLRHRVLTPQFRTHTLGTRRFVQHYEEMFHEHLNADSATTTSYDALYLVALAAAAAGDGVLTGESLARAFPRLEQRGVSLEVEPGNILAFVKALANGGGVDVVGTSGSLDFDPKTGDAAVDLVASCLAVDENGLVTDAIESGLWLDGSSGRLAGKLSCP